MQKKKDLGLCVICLYIISIHPIVLGRAVELSPFYPDGCFHELLPILFPGQACQSMHEIWICIPWEYLGGGSHY